LHNSSAAKPSLNYPSGPDGFLFRIPASPLCQLLADGTETDACSGNIAKHYHAALTAEYLEEASVPLCSACQQRDSRRAAALA
jgi:hypothetical protein